MINVSGESYRLEKKEADLLEILAQWTFKSGTLLLCVLVHFWVTLDIRDYILNLHNMVINFPLIKH